MRYFLISYQSCIEEYKHAFGDMMIYQEDFPNRKTLSDELKKSFPNLKSFVILGIYEFKNKTDYNRFLLSDEELSIIK